MWSEKSTKLWISKIIRSELNNINLARSLSRLILSNSKIWFLDEPTNGLDKINTVIFFKILKQHLQLNGLAIIASHDDVKIKNKNINLSVN